MPEAYEALLNACFEDRDLIDDIFWDEAHAIDMRHAIDRERLRLQRLAETEARRIRKEIGSCTACRNSLPSWADLRIPPQFCSKDCVPPPPDESRASDFPW